ncbi:hypothetical protein ACIRF8_12625 [Streptomyces sp. NPDC102406]|uniref:hypothetical protein n=1 Tax=Streptomyces sp. NPDC102406 TaxID=3366171 RepID=UPI00380C75FB
MWGRKQQRIAELVARVEQLVEERDAARADAAALRGTAVRVAGRNTQLTEQNQRLTVAHAQHDADIDATLARVDRALRGCARYRAALATEARRADQLQARLDDALGLNTPGVERGQLWQTSRQDKPREVKP